MDLTTPDLQGDITQGYDAWETFRDIFKIEDDVVTHFCMLLPQSQGNGVFLE